MKKNSRYLTLALEFRRLSDDLIRLVETGQDQIGESLVHLLRALVAPDTRTSAQSLRERGSFAAYESAVTLTEAIRPEELKRLMSRLEGVLDRSDEEARKRNAIEAVVYVDALERRALYHYNHPRVERQVANFAR